MDGRHVREHNTYSARPFARLSPRGTGARHLPPDGGTRRSPLPSLALLVARLVGAKGVCRAVFKIWKNVGFAAGGHICAEFRGPGSAGHRGRRTRTGGAGRAIE